jgi:hypothetical protein
MQLTIESVFRDSHKICEETLRDQGIGNKVLSLSLYSAACSALYGLSMGLGHSGVQALASMAKVPVLFLATLAITLPALHFVGLFFGSTARLGQTLTLLLTGISTTCALLAAFTPVSLLFLISESSYRFMLLLHLLIFSFCGGAGLWVILRNSRHFRSAEAISPNGTISARSLGVWTVLYALVGLQMSFLLSPFLAPQHDFFLLNPNRGSVFSYLLGVFFG